VVKNQQTSGLSRIYKKYQSSSKALAKAGSEIYFLSLAQAAVSQVAASSSERQFMRF